MAELKSTVAGGGEEESMTTLRAKSKDEEGMNVHCKVMITSRSRDRPDTLSYMEKKLEDKGIYRKDRHPIDGLGVHHPPPKSGHGGKFTWEGPAANELDPAPAAIDPGDPNYVDEEEEEQSRPLQQEEEEEEEEFVIGEVEVAKLAEARKAVARVEVRPPLTPN